MLFRSLAGIYYGSINLIAPVMTMICLVSYGVLNLSAGIETLMSNPSWRPLFRVHWLVSIIGALFCLLTMLMIDAGVAIISLVGVVGIYLAVKKNKFQGSWADIRQGILMYISRFSIYELAYGPSFLKSWRPHFLVFTKSSDEYSHSLLSFTEAVSQSRSFLTMATFFSESKINPEKRIALSEIIAKRFKSKNIHTFVSICDGENVSLEMRYMLKYYGLGPLKPNTVIFGGIKKGNEIDDFIETIKIAHQRSYNIVIVDDDIESISSLDQGLNRDIHVWWDDQDQDSSELMLVFAYMMQRNPERKKCRVCLKAIVADERARHGKIKHFQELSLKLRMPLNIEVYVSAEQQKTMFQFINTFSKDADIVMTILKHPDEMAEGELYKDYLKKVSKVSESNPNIVYVLSSEHTPLDSILL